MRNLRGWAIDRPKSWCYSARRKVLVQDRKPSPGTLGADNESRVEGKFNPSLLPSNSGKIDAAVTLTPCFNYFPLIARHTRGFKLGWIDGELCFIFRLDSDPFFFFLYIYQVKQGSNSLDDRKTMKNEVKGAMRIRCYSCKIDSRMKYGIFINNLF